MSLPGMQSAAGFKGDDMVQKPGPGLSANGGGSAAGSLAMGLQGGGAALDALGSIMGGYSQAKAYKAQAAMARANADAANRSGALNAEAVLREGRMALGAQSAGVAENGLGFSGSALDSLEQSAGNVAFDANNALYSGLVKANDFNNDAAAARSAAKNAVTGGWIGAASKLMQAGAQLLMPGV